MSYRLHTDESLRDGLVRIATQEASYALKELHRGLEGDHEAVHAARKRFKKIRAVLRLARCEFPEDLFQAEKNWYRDAGRSLAQLRDAQAMVETMDRLRDRFGDRLPDPVSGMARHRLIQRRDRIASATGSFDDRVRRVITDLPEAMERITDWPLSSDFGPIGEGLRRVHRSGRRRFRRAYANPTPERFHEWRKRIKDQWYHARLFHDVWPGVMEGYARMLKLLSDVLGDDHDLAVLRQFVLVDAPAFGEHEVYPLTDFIDLRRSELEVESRSLGERWFADTPRQHAERLYRYWEQWGHEATHRHARPPVSRGTMERDAITGPGEATVPAVSDNGVAGAAVAVGTGLSEGRPVAPTADRQPPHPEADRADARDSAPE